MCKFRSKEDLLKMFGFLCSLCLLVAYILLLMAIFIFIPIWAIPLDMINIISTWWLIVPLVSAANFILCKNSIFVIIYHKLNKHLERYI